MTSCMCYLHVNNFICRDFSSCQLLPCTCSASRVKRSVLVYIMYICLWTKKKESYLSDQLTFSNISGRTSCQIYRLVLPLCAPETLSLLSKLRISLFNVHLALIVQRMTQLRLHNPIGKCCQWRASETSKTLSGLFNTYVVFVF